MKKTRSFVSFLSHFNSGNLRSAVSASIVLCMGASRLEAATITWDGNGVSATDLGTAVNWSGDVLPNVATPDTAQWNGFVSGPLSLVYSNAAFAGAAGNAGINLDITAAQTSSLNIDSGTNTGSIRMNGLTIASGAGAFSLGNSANTLNLTLGGAAGTHTWTNNSSNAVTIASDVVWGLGGGSTHTLAIGGTGNWNFNNVMGQGTGTLSISKSGTGTATLAGVNTYTGTTAVTAGTLDYTGSVGVATATGAFSIGASGGGNAVLNTPTGSTLRLNNVNMSVGLGITNTTGQGFVNQSGGTVSGINQLQIGAGASGSSYGYYKMSGGTLGLAELDLGGFNGASTGVMDFSAGTVNVSGWIVPARGVSGVGILNMTGGTLNFTGPAAQIQANWGAGAGSVTAINIANSSFIAAPANVNLMQTGTAGKLGEINLLSGGLMQVNSIAPGSATGTSLLNFNGGTLKANAATTTFTTANLTGAFVHSGGGTIDNNGVAITVPSALQAPSGNGVSSVAITSGGSGYLGAPAVTFTGGGGVGASGYAVLTGGAVTSIVITNPGTGYTTAPTVVLTGGGGTGATTGTVATAVNTSGGMTFAGLGTTTLSGASTYTGATSVSTGKVSVTGSLAAGSAVSVSNGATLGGTGTVGGAATIASGGILEGGVANAGKLTLGGLSFNGAANVNIGALSNYAASTAIGAGALNLSGGTGAVVINISSLGSATAGNTYKILDYTSLGGTGFAGFSLASLPSRGIGNLVNTGTGIDLSLTSLDYLKWTGSASSSWDTTSSNWKLNSNNNPASYINSPGDSVVFEDPASFNTLVDISTVDVAPAGIVFNNATEYFVQGTKGIIGVTGIVKNNTGAVTISTPNTYSGGTTINAGTINIDNASAIGTGTLTLAGGTINTGSSAIALTTNNAQNWNSDFQFPGSNDLNLGTGAVTMSGSRIITTDASTLTVGGVISGTDFGLVKNGDGTLVLGGVNTYNGGTTLNAGTLQLNQSTGAAATGTINLNGGTFVVNAGANNFGYAPTINQTVDMTFSKAGASQINYTGILTGTGNVLNLNSNTSRLYMNGTVSGITQINVTAGAMGFDLNVGNRGGGVPVNVANGASLWLANATNTLTNNLTFNGGTGQGALGSLYQEGNGNPFVSGIVTLASGVSNFGGNTATGNVTISGKITGAGGLTKIGVNKYIFSAANDYAGPTTVSAGTLAAGVASVPNVSGAFGNNTAVSFANVAGALMDITGFNTQIGSLTGGGATGGNVTLGAATLTTGADNTSPAAYAGAISGTGGLVKIGAGTQILSGANSLTGGVTVNGGTLAAIRNNNAVNPVTSALGNPQIAYDITVNNTATLNFAQGDTLGGATSVIAPTLIVNAGGTVTNTINFFTSLGPVTLNGGTLTTAGGAVAGYQSYSLTGNITVGGTAASTISVTGAGNAFNGIHLGTNTVFNVADATGSTASDLDVSTPLINRNASLGGAGGLTKSGAGTMTMTGVNTYTGDTIVSGGKLSISNVCLADAADVRLTTGAKLDLTFSAGTPDTIDELYIDGVQQAMGTWGAIGSGATHTSALITGTGILNVTTGTVSSSYGGWESTYSLGANSENGDPDFDGIKNLMEYVLGGIPTGAGASDTSILPTQSLDATNLTLTFRRSDLSESDTAVKVQWSADMVTWTDFVTVGAVDALPAVDVTEDSPSSTIDTVVVKIPRAGREAGGKLFGRVTAIK